MQDISSPSSSSQAYHKDLTTDQKNSILKKRAEKLSEVSRVEQKEEQIEVVVFYLANERYAIESLYIREVYPLKELTSLPGVPPFVLGIINARRKILSVIDLKVFLNISSTAKPNNNKVIILEDSEMEYAILTDGIDGIHKILVKEIQPTLPTLTGIKQEFLKGVTADQLIVLDGNRLLKDKKLLVHDEI